MSVPDLSSRDGIFDLFCGAGGFSWGWERAGFQPWVAVDFDGIATRTHEINFPRAHTLHRDLTEFRPADLAEIVGPRPRNLLAIVGGPPCQGWSSAGRAKLRSLASKKTSILNDPRNRLYKRFLSFVDYFRPPICVMENVPGMLSIEGSNVAETIATHFTNIGYRSTFALVNARWFGAPQDRRRLIFFGVRGDLKLQLQANDLKEFALRFKKDLLGLPGGDTSVRQAISDLPKIRHGAREDPTLYRTTGNMSRYVKLMRQRSNGMLTDHISREHNAQDLKAFSSMPEGGLYHELDARFKRYRDDIFKDKYRKLRWDSTAGTVTAHLSKDCYTHIHPSQRRTVSVREAARLQTFPDDFRFFGNMGDRFRQIGNAVPPLMAFGIAQFVKEAIEGK